MNSKDEFIDKWLKFEKKNVPEFIVNCLGQNKTNELLKQKLMESYELMNSMVKAEKQYSTCNIHGATIADYKYKYLTTNFGEMITSIRFIGGDLKKPAVFIMHRDFNLDHPKIIQQVGHLIKSEYRVFNPQRFRWFSATDESKLIEKYRYINGDQFIIAEFIDSLRKNILKETINDISIKLATTLHWYNTFVSEYKNFISSDPMHVEMAWIGSKEMFTKLMSNNLLFEAYYNNELIGVIGATKTTNWFMDGYLIVEEIIFEKYRRKGFAVKMQKQFIKELSNENNELVFGTIHYKNHASQKTATRCGRQFAGMYIFSDI